jgi:kynurenine formamidase
MTIPGLPTGGPFGDQKLVYNDEYLATEIGQIGTQFDGPGHIGVITSKGEYFYNGRYLSDADISAYGVGSLGVEHVAEIGFVCRGVLLDAVALRGGQLPIPKAKQDPGIITVADIEAMIKNQGIDPIGEGDCVFLYTGHGDIWHPSKWDTFDAAEFECHIKMMTRSGIWNIENLDLSQLVADKAYEFLFAWSPLKMKGATGSPGNPIAMY